MTTALTLRAGPQPLWLCFEPWATEYTVAPNTAVVIKFDRQTPIELAHHPNGITFISFGCHPDIWSADGEPVEIFSEFMPETPSGLGAEAFRPIMTAVPPTPPRLDAS
jgi:hypothetical protein